MHWSAYSAERNPDDFAGAEMPHTNRTQKLSFLSFCVLTVLRGISKLLKTGSQESFNSLPGHHSRNTVAFACLQKDLLAAFDLTASSGESAEKELLGQVGAHPFEGAERKISEDQPDTTIGSGIVKIPQG
jgi:hypothetical protein